MIRANQTHAVSAGEAENERRGSMPRNLPTPYRNARLRSVSTRWGEAADEPARVDARPTEIENQPTVKGR
jgi:hypothetical protein